MAISWSSRVVRNRADSADVSASENTKSKAFPWNASFDRLVAYLKKT
jgi:hypothetical protein